jgi:hypothetical protein
MNFGEPYLRVSEPNRLRPNKRWIRPRGQSWLWVYLAYWQISFDKATAAKGGTLDSRCPYKKILRAIYRLDGQIVTAIKVKPKSGSLRLTFDLGGRLDVWPIHRKRRKDIWILYPANKEATVLTVRSDGKYSDTPEGSAANWQSIS